MRAWTRKSIEELVRSYAVQHGYDKGGGATNTQRGDFILQTDGWYTAKSNVKTYTYGRLGPNSATTYLKMLTEDGAYIPYYEKLTVMDFSVPIEFKNGIVTSVIQLPTGYQYPLSASTPYYDLNPPYGRNEEYCAPLLHRIIIGDRNDDSYPEYGWWGRGTMMFVDTPAGLKYVLPLNEAVSLTDVHITGMFDNAYDPPTYAVREKASWTEWNVTKFNDILSRLATAWVETYYGTYEGEYYATLRVKIMENNNSNWSPDAVRTYQLPAPIREYGFETFGDFGRTKVLYI